MDQWNAVGMRAFGPAVIVLLITGLLMVVLSNVPANLFLAGFAAIVRWVPLVALAAMAWLVVAPAYRLWRWQRGEGPSCPHCSGPLGHERAGYSSRGGAFRRCYACGGNINHRHYE